MANGMYISPFHELVLKLDEKGIHVSEIQATVVEKPLDTIIKGVDDIPTIIQTNELKEVFDDDCRESILDDKSHYQVDVIRLAKHPSRKVEKRQFDKLEDAFLFAMEVAGIESNDYLDSILK